MSRLRTPISLTVVFALAACASPAATVTAPPAQPAATVDVTRAFAQLQTEVAATDAALAPTAEPPTAAAPVGPTAEPASAFPGEAGDEAILILEPGPASEVVSPVVVAGLSDPAFEQTIIVQVLDESGETIGATATQINADLGQRGPFRAELTFNLSADQPGRILVFATSARDGGLTHLTSAEVTLRTGGAPVITAAARSPEAVALFEPQLLASVGGGALHLRGFADYVFENILNVALCGAGGSGAPDFLCGASDNLLATGSAYVASPDIGQPGSFEGDLAYSVPGPLPARLVVYSTSPRDGGLTHLSSVEVQLAP